MRIRLRSSKRKPLIESWDPMNGKLDLERGIVRDVKVLGARSKNGYGYSSAAMKKAAPLYEGIRVNIDHPTKADEQRGSRSYGDRFGSLKNVKFNEQKNGIFGDFHYNKKHRLAEQFEYDVQHSPNNLGFSHNAVGDVEGRGKSAMVKLIENVSSVDLVADPATTGGLFESQRTVKRRKKVKESLGSELGDTPTPREQLAKLLESIMLDGTLSAKQRKEKILKCLEMDTDDSSRSSNTSVEESVKTKLKKPAPNSRELREAQRKTERALKEAEKLRADLAARNHRDRVRTLCESMEFAPKPLQLKALLGMKTKRECKQLIESFIGEKTSRRRKESAKTSKKPKSRLSESEGATRLKESELDAWLEGLMDDEE